MIYLFKVHLSFLFTDIDNPTWEGYIEGMWLAEALLIHMLSFFWWCWLILSLRSYLVFDAKYCRCYCCLFWIFNVSVTVRYFSGAWDCRSLSDNCNLFDRPTWMWRWRAQSRVIAMYRRDYNLQRSIKKKQYADPSDFRH